ncbi:MAG: STAS domain-containing protein [Pseudomonadota bacterium]
MGLAAREHDGYSIVDVEGPRLDAAHADGFKADLKELIDAGNHRIMLDFSKVQFMDSSGLGAVVGCMKYLGSTGTLEIAGPTPPVQKVLKLTRMNKVFTIHDSPPPR